MDNLSVQSIRPQEAEGTQIDSPEKLIEVATNNIRQESYGVASDMLMNKKMGYSLGYEISEGQGIPISIESANDPEEVQSYSNYIAANSFQGMTRGYMSSPNTIIYPKPFLVDNSSDTPKFTMEVSNFPKELAHEVDLVALEEWLHILQAKTGRPLTYFLDPEVDVAYWMLQNGIKLTPAFLGRYNRAEMLAKLTDDVQAYPGEAATSPRQFPTFRSGAFVKVERSNGAVEADWQISSFNPINGNAIVQRGDLVKEIPRRELEAANAKSPSRPFWGTSDFMDLFSRLNSLPDLVIVDTDTQMSREEIKREINNIRSGNGDINKIPTVGGLRAIVHQLAGLN